MNLLTPFPRTVTRPLSILVLIAWAGTMAAVVNRSYLQASTANLATDLAKYGPTAVWRGVYYRGDKLGFTVSQTTRTSDGFELREDGRIQMLLLGQDTAAVIRTVAQVDVNFVLRSFEFSLDPGTGPTEVRGTLEPPAGGSGMYRLALAITSAGVTRTEVRELPEAPVTALNLARMLASGRLVPGSRHQWTILDPATLRIAPVTVRVGSRAVVRSGETVVPAFRVDLEFEGLRTTSWMTDTGDVVREESPLGLMTVRETPERAQGLAVSSRVQADLLRAAAIVPVMRQRIDEPRDVRRLRVRLDGAELPQGDLEGVGQTADGNVIEIIDAQSLVAGPLAPDARHYLAPEPLIESDAPAILAEAERAVRGATTDRQRAERLTRHVNALLDKKPTISLPSALEVLRTRVGDCNEHTALYVAMARSIGLPSRVAVGLVFMRGAFYYHAWAEVYVREGRGGLWLPADPTFNQFPADGTHLRLARRPGEAGRDSSPHRTPSHDRARSGTGARGDTGARRARGIGRGRTMIAIQNLVKEYGRFRAVDGVSLEVRPGEIHGFLGPNGAGKTTTLRMIAGLLKPSSGCILVNGHNLESAPEAAKGSLGFIPDRPFIYDKLTAGEFLRFHAGLYGLDGEGVPGRVHEMLDLFELRRWEHELVESFSHGMKQRLVMASAFLHRPRAVAVDEPMVGLDPRGARLIKDVFRRMSERGVAILMSTHTLEVAQEMCHRISIIQGGRIIAQGTVDEVRAIAGGGTHDQLTSVFLKLTGGSALQELDEAV